MDLMADFDWDGSFGAKAKKGPSKYYTLRRLAQLAIDAQKVPSFQIEKHCFSEQIAFINDESNFTTACCSRRAGKTIACASDLIREAIRSPNTIQLYITLSRVNGKRIIWPELKNINHLYKLGGEPNESELSLRLPNQSIIYVSGAKDKTQIQNFLGLPIKKVYIDEAQSFGEYIRELIDDVLAKAMYDYDGHLRLIGTPRPVPSGYFYEACHSEQWSRHAWTMMNNPWLEKKSGKTPMQLIQQDCDRRGITMDDPSIQRECFGRWVLDLNTLVFKYDASINHFDHIPAINETVMGVDLGYDDSDSISVIGWANQSPNAYLLEESVKAKQGITPLVQDIERLMKKYNPLRIVMDTGGLGKKIAEEIGARYSIPVEAAEKTRKLEYIELLNDAMRTKRFFAKKNSKFAQDCMLVEWDRDKSKEKMVISDSYHSDATDSALYAWRSALSWLYEPEVKKPKLGTPEWINKQAEEMESSLIEQLQKQKEDDGW